MKYPQITQISALWWVAIEYLKKSSRLAGGLVRALRGRSSQAKLHIIVSVERRAARTHLHRPGEIQPSAEICVICGY
jgi:hypothetical protein